MDPLAPVSCSRIFRIRIRIRIRMKMRCSIRNRLQG
jgi:hypothetical protein